MVELAVGRGLSVAAKHRAPMAVGHTEPLILSQLHQFQGWQGGWKPHPAHPPHTHLERSPVDWNFLFCTT